MTWAQEAALFPEHQGNSIHPLPTLTQNWGPGHEGLAVLWTQCRRGRPDHNGDWQAGDEDKEKNGVTHQRCWQTGTHS